MALDPVQGQARLWAGLVLTALLALTAAAGPWFYPEDPDAVDLDRALEGISPRSPLGRDELGRDLLARTIYGARMALWVSGGGVLIGAAGGVWLGMWCGYAGGAVNRLFTRCVDVLLAFPGLLLALGVAAVLGPGTKSLIAAVGVFSFPPFARVASSLIRSLKKERYVEAARAAGAGEARIIARHILPAAAAPLVSFLSMRMAHALATASGLSFLGLGPPLPTPEWGVMLDLGREYLWIAPRLVIVPGCALFLAALGFYLIGEGLSHRAVDWNN